MRRLQPGQTPGHIIVIGNEKGGSGKSTTAMHLIVGLIGLGHSVASMDVDVRQKSLTRYLENRRGWIDANGQILVMPSHQTATAGNDETDAGARERIGAVIQQMASEADVVVIDTPGNATPVASACHAWADTLITPINDSFVDLDVLARVESDGRDGAERYRVTRPSHYSEMVWQARQRRAARDGGSVDWIVMRNRLSSLDAHNKRRVEQALGEMSPRFGFRLIPGFGERVIYRELFVNGLTLMDLGEAVGGEALTLSHVAARQEVRALIEALSLPAATTSPATAVGG